MNPNIKAVIIGVVAVLIGLFIDRLFIGKFTERFHGKKTHEEKEEEPE